MTFDAPSRRARRLMYGRRWYLNPLRWNYRARVLRPGIVAAHSALIVHNARLSLLIAELDRALAEYRESPPTEPGEHADGSQ